MFSAGQHLVALSIAFLAALSVASALPEAYCQTYNSTHYHLTHNHTHTWKHCQNGTDTYHWNHTHTHHHESKVHPATVTTVDLTSGGFGPVSYIFVGFRNAHESAPAVTSIPVDTALLQKRQLVTNTVTVTVTSDSTISVTVTATPPSSAVSTITSLSTSATTTLSLTTTSPTATNCPALVGSPGYNSFGIINGSYTLSQAGPACQACNLKLANLTILDAGIVRSSSFSQVAWVNSWNGDNYGGAPLLFYPGLEIASPLASTNASALCYTGQIDELAVYFSQTNTSSSSSSTSSSSS